MSDNFPLSPMVISYLSSLSRTEIAHVADIAIERLDKLDGDPDLEPNGDDEPARANGDCDDCAWVEWNTMRGSQKSGPNIIQRHEDDEDDDPAGQYDEDHYSGPVPKSTAAGCPISDPDYEHDGREEGY